MSTSTQLEPSSSTINPPKQMNSHGQKRPTKRTIIMRIIGRTMLGVIVLLGLAIVISWIFLIPKTPIYSLESGNVTAHSLTDRKLNATIVFTIKSYNPNRRSTIEISSMKMIVDSMDQKFQSTVPPFSQLPGNQTYVTAAVKANIISPFGRLNETVRLDGIKLVLHFSAKIRYIVEKWMSQRRLLEIYCDEVTLKLNTSTAFDNPKCTVDL